MFLTIKNEWFSNIRADVLAGIVVALALIPEAIAFSIIAGVDPMVGLYASFSMAIVIAFAGGRPAMISAATGAMALLMVTLVKEHGLQYLFAATILTGIIQIIFGVLKLGAVMKFVPRSVMVGFVNSLAILIFMAQLPQFTGQSWMMYMMVAAGLVIIYLFPRITKAVPSPLVAIIVITTFALFTHIEVRTVGDMGKLTSALPPFGVPAVPFTWETVQIIFPYAFMLAMVGLLESLLTAAIVDDMTDTDSNKNRESCGQGIANIVTGFLGGMAGCAMIGQSVINVKSGARGRLSTFVAGAFLLFLIMVLKDLVIQIPMAALVAVMIMVSIGTFDWKYVMSLHKVPKSDALVMIVTVITVVWTHNLAIGVFIGILLSMVLFAAKISKIDVQITIVDNKKIYTVNGQLFFASVTNFVEQFDFKDDVKEVDIDLSNAHIWDDSGVGAIDKVMLKYQQKGTHTKITGLNTKSSQLLERIAVYDKPAVGH
ncbi:SulP family inorganic anion transporter [Ectobacillus antri]|uniref:SulP family inorganic anion transporter n=1 Tax=Ectobacillus antri TaxID=2486280 RepID=A0ABT6H5L9_9BACI|nr:SulP family inorganic anion transporter [Ectobacillus antri]MDG4657341.1 SulP family inorganic anion transporter [Ectobacillus antri]MDG5754528.1 SulP family inorganic anion transporter [Ectobacillus antri]